MKVIKYQQKQLFKEEINILKNDKRLSNKSWISKLSPFINAEDKLLRVGGRLINANINFNRKYPILISKCHMIDLIIKYIHINHGHSGIGLTERLVKDEYWVPALKRRIKKIIHACPTCIRWRAAPSQPAMANLPEERVIAAPPFFKTGIDLCGPFLIKASRIKFDKVIKVWVAVFICLVTKAIHLEICSDLSTENFLAALTRFIGRRSCPGLIMTDNGTNFCGANRRQQEGWKSIIDASKEVTAIQQITWKFIPPYSPTFGGIWEAAVKSMKYFVKRMANVEKLNFEEFGTLLCRIEGLLNSRPLYPNPTNPDEDPALTPFHFLGQRSYNVAPSDFGVPLNCPVTKKWLAVLQIQKQFWDKFNNDYLNHLQKKYKWQHPTRSLKIGDLVILHEPNCSPGLWKMGRIIEEYPDKQGEVRKFEVKVSPEESVQRAAKRLVPLLPEEDEMNIPPRQNPKRNIIQVKKGIKTSVITNLMIILSIIASTQATIINPLSPGVTLYKLREVEIKAFDLSLDVKTTINITEDISIINNHVKEFKEFCLNIENYIVSNHCIAVFSSVEIESNATIKQINMNYNNNRKKRFIPVIAKHTVTALIKYAPHILLATGMIYQTAEINKLNRDINEVKSKMTRLSKLMLNVTDMEYQTIDQTMSEIIEQQRKILLEEQVNDYAIGTKGLIDNMKSRYQNLVNIRPTTELRNYVSEANANLSMFSLPQINDERLFTMNKAEIRVEQEIIIIKFKIPMVHPNKYDEYAIINTPTKTNEITKLGNNQLIQKIAMNKKNSTMFFPSKAIEGENNMYQNVTTEIITPCIATMFAGNTGEEINSECMKNKVDIDNDKIYWLKPNLCVIWLSTIPSKSTKLFCNKTEETLEAKASIVKLEDCQLVYNEVQINDMIMESEIGEKNEKMNEIYQEITPIKLKINNVTRNPRINEARGELTRELAMDIKEGRESQQLYIFGVTIIILVIILFWFYFNRGRAGARTNSQQWSKRMIVTNPANAVQIEMIGL